MKLPVTQDVELAQKEAGKAVKAANAIKVETPETFYGAGDLLQQVVNAKRVLSDSKAKFIKPAKEIIDQAKELFEPFEKDVAEAERIIKNAMVEFAKLIEADRERVAGRLEARVERGTMKLDTAIRKVGELADIDYKAAGVSKSVSKKVRIVNRDLVPQEFWGIDEVLVRKVALGNKAQGVEPVEIPGVEIYEDTSLSMR